MNGTRARRVKIRAAVIAAGKTPAEFNALVLSVGLLYREFTLCESSPLCPIHQHCLDSYKFLAADIVSIVGQENAIEIREDILHSPIKILL